MWLCTSLVCLVLVVDLGLGDETFFNMSDIQLAPRAPRDRFRLMVSNVNEDRVQDEVTDFLNYGCEKMVIIRNRAQDEFRLSCRSNHDAPKSVVVQQGNAFLFTFRPLRTGDSKFWCEIEYRQRFARFFVYQRDVHYMCPREVDEIYQYTVDHDGVYADGRKDGGSTKIRALFKGHNTYILWEEYENGVPDGLLVSGEVDGGMCTDMPDKFNDKAAAVTMCHNQCVKLFEHYGCRGKTQLVQALSNDCVEFGLSEELVGKLSAIQGC